ncbi:MAG: hypothetical protein HQL26_01920 [Candidatus Omnitrophica bacterium]|nr:hypothetical protein [Candidatus Omnitrophota bacterium]
MKKLILLTMALAATAFVFSIAEANDYTVSANVPTSAGDILLVSHQGTANASGGADYVWTTDIGPKLDFGILKFDDVNKVFYSNTSYVIEASNTAGRPVTVTLSYKEGALPGAATKGLGYRILATLQKAVYDTTQPGNTKETNLATKALRNIPPSIPKATLSPGWFRIYLGIWRGKADGSTPDSDLTFTTAADVTGDYSGTLTVSATTN